MKKKEKDQIINQKSEKKHPILTFLVLESTLVLLAFWIVSLIVKTNVQMSEGWVRSVSRAYFVILSATFKYIPFSIMEVFFVFFFSYAIFLIVTFIISCCKKRKEKIAKKSLLICHVAIAYFSMYSLTAGISYNRDVVDLPQYEENVDSSKFKEIAAYYVNDYNYCASQLEFDENGEVIMPYSYQELNKIIGEEYKKINSDYFTSFTTWAKPMLSSFIFREFGITGVFFAPTGEANFNYLATNAEKPFVISHELSHSKGVMREDDAQLTALFICLTSEDPYLRYSAYSETFFALLDLQEYSNESSYSEIYSTLDNKIRQNRYYIYNYYDSHNLFETIGDFINNLYLKIEGMEEGIEHYVPVEETEVIIIPPEEGHEDEPPIEKVVIVDFSTYQKLYFWHYFNFVL